MQLVQFIDPAAVLTTYTWERNPPPDSVTASQKTRQITRTSNTANIGATRQQGDDGSYIIHWEPRVVSANHEKALWQWYKLCKTQSIYLVDWNGEKYEGQIITLERQQIGAVGGPGDIHSRRMYAQYIFEFDVWTFLSGLLHDAGVLT